MMKFDTTMYVSVRMCLPFSLDFKTIIINIFYRNLMMTGGLEEL